MPGKINGGDDLSPIAANLLTSVKFKCSHIGEPLANCRADIAVVGMRDEELKPPLAAVAYKKSS